jgi:hypothetical protein
MTKYMTEGANHLQCDKPLFESLVEIVLVSTFNVR